jgi:outer membrane protein insertion porin family
MRRFSLDPMALSGLVVLMSACWAIAAGQVPEAEMFGKAIRKIEYIDVESKLVLDRAHYDRSTGLLEGETLTRTGLKVGIQALYDIGSFSEISVVAHPEGDGVGIQFQLRRALYFNRFLISGDLDLGGRALTEAIELPVGVRFSTARLEEARQAVVRYAADKGFYQAEVRADWKRIGNGVLVDTTFEVKPGKLAKVRSLNITGIPANEANLMREKLGLKPGADYRRDRFLKRLDALKSSLVDRGFLGAELQSKEDYQQSDNSIALDLAISNYGRVRIAIEGFKIPKDQLRRLLPVLSGEGLAPELVEEGSTNLKEYLEESGYPEAAVSIQESTDSVGSRLLRYTIDRGRKVMVHEVLFHGNLAFTPANLIKSLQIQPSPLQQKVAYTLTRVDALLQQATYAISKLDADVESLRSLYRSSGYLDVVVIPLIEPIAGSEQLRITYDISEGARARVKSVSIDVTDGPPEVDLSAKMRLKAGEPYSPYLAERDRQAIFAAYSDAGFEQPDVSYHVEGPDDLHEYRVGFKITQGNRAYVENVVVLGKGRTRASVIDKRIQVKPNEPLSLGKMLETQQALYNTGVFDLVRVEPQNPGSQSPYQTVIVRVQEARPRTLRYGFGYQEREKIRGLLEISDLNIFGMGQSANLRLRGSWVEQSGVLSFKQPQVRFLPVDSYFTFSASKLKQVSFVEKRLDLSYQYSHALNNHSWSLWRYNLTNVRVSNAPADLAREERPRNLSSFSAIYINDTRDNYTDRNAKYLDPQKGFFTSTDLGFTVNHGGGGYYVSLYSQNSYYRRLKGKLLMASSFRLGLLGPIGGDTSVPAGERIPISERFFAGGAASLRGFATDRAGPLGQNQEPIGGNMLLIGNLELRLPLISRTELAVFYDGGNVYPTPGEIRLSTFSHTIGLGLRVKTPLGPIRIDYGFNLNLSNELRSFGYKTGHFFLTIGPPF